MIDDGKCHLCRQVPLVESSRYRFTTCEDCDATADARSSDQIKTLRWLAAVTSAMFSVGLLVSIALMALRALL